MGPQERPTCASPVRFLCTFCECVCVGFWMETGPPTCLPRAQTCGVPARVRQRRVGTSYLTPGRNVRLTPPLNVLAGGRAFRDEIPAKCLLCPSGCWQDGVGP